jgi:diketogulonate reductase-like aldo/keto reductase
MEMGFIYGTAWKEEDTERCVREALGAGFRAIDTANQRKHYFEAGVGAALKAAWASGSLKRGDLFIQTKFTFRDGQDHRLPYDPEAPVASQVAQSFASSLEHLGTDYLDSYVLHGPTTSRGLDDEDWEAWHAMEELQLAGKVRALGVSNVNLEQVKLLISRARVKPKYAQIRCFARRAWDRELRAYCREQGILYQGFSLLTANGEIFRHPRFHEILGRAGCTPAQLVFGFALSVGMLPLTGTTDPEHMKEDLESVRVKLSAADVSALESISTS